MAYTTVLFAPKFFKEGMRAFFPDIGDLKVVPMTYTEEMGARFFQKPGDLLRAISNLKFKIGKADPQNFTGATTNDVYNAIVATAKNNNLTLTVNEVMTIAVFAAITRQTYAYWFHALKQTIAPHAQNLFQIEISRNKNSQITANYVEKDKQVGEYTGSTSIRGELETLAKIKGSGILKATAENAYTVEPSLETFQIETTVWAKRLLLHAFAYLRDLTEDFNAYDLFLLTPFLTDPKFRSTFAIRLNEQKNLVASKELVADFVKLCFEGNIKTTEDTLKALGLPRTALEGPSSATTISRSTSLNHLPDISLSRASTSANAHGREGEGSQTTIYPQPFSNGNSNGGPSAPSPSASSLVQSGVNTYPFNQPLTPEQQRTQQQQALNQQHFQQMHQSHQPPPRTQVQTPALTTAQRYAHEKQAMEGLENKLGYGTSQYTQIKAINAALNDLNSHQVAAHQAMLIDVMAASRRAVADPYDQTNLNNLNTLIKPLHHKNLVRLAGAVSLLVIGVLLAVVSTAAAVASFGGTHLLSAWGIAVAHTTLTKALTLAGSVVGTSLFVGGLVLFSRNPINKIHGAADAIAIEASKEQLVHPRPARA
jgi:hypothetical protein